MNVAAEDYAGYRPCLILAHADPVYTAQVVRTFRRHGWDVYPAQSGPEVRRLARMLEPQLVRAPGRPARGERLAHLRQTDRGNSRRARSFSSPSIPRRRMPTSPSSSAPPTWPIAATAWPPCCASDPRTGPAGGRLIGKSHRNEPWRRVALSTVRFVLSEASVMAQPTPLHNAAARTGAVFTEEAGWSVPAHFGGPLREYEQARAGCVLFDQSHRGKLELTGSEAARFLHNLTTQDVLKLPPGEGREAFAVTAKSRVVAYFLLFHEKIAARRLGLLAQPAAGHGREDAQAPRPLPHQRTGRVRRPHPRLRPGPPGGAAAAAVLEKAAGARPAAVEGVEGAGLLPSTADAVRHLPARPARPARLRLVLPDGRPDRGGLGTADPGGGDVAGGPVEPADGSRSRPGRPRGVRDVAVEAGTPAFGSGHRRRTRSCRKSAGPSRRYPTPRAATSARSRSSWPATAARSTARCSALS